MHPSPETLSQKGGCGVCGPANNWRFAWQSNWIIRKARPLSTQRNSTNGDPTAKCPAILPYPGSEFCSCLSGGRDAWLRSHLPRTQTHRPTCLLLFPARSKDGASVSIWMTIACYVADGSTSGLREPPLWCPDLSCLCAWRVRRPRRPLFEMDSLDRRPPLLTPFSLLLTHTHTPTERP